MASDDTLLAYMSLPLADRRAVERLLPVSKRQALQEQVRRRLENERREKERTRNPAALLACSPPLSKYLLAVVSDAPGTDATEKTRSAIRQVIERCLAAS